MNSKSPADWSTSFYQYGNRLAHLYWMRELNGHDAYLVNLVLRSNDREMNGPQSASEWQAAIQLQEVFLGVRQTSYALDSWVGAYVPRRFHRRERHTRALSAADLGRNGRTLPPPYQVRGRL